MKRLVDSLSGKVKQKDSSFSVGLRVALGKNELYILAGLLLKALFRAFFVLRFSLRSRFSKVVDP